MRFSIKHLTKVGVAVGLCLASTGFPAMAEVSSQVRRGLPGRRISGGTRRTECYSQIGVLEPASGSKSIEGETTLDFWIAEFDDVYPVDFRLRDSKGHTAYRQSLQTSNKEQFISIQIPKDALQTNLDYHWSFSVVCDAGDRSQDINLSGQLQLPTIAASNSHREEFVDVVNRHAVK